MQDKLTIGFLATAPSHLQTYFAVEKSLRNLEFNLKLYLIDLVDFYSWTTMELNYQGQADRLAYTAPSFHTRGWSYAALIRENFKLQESFIKLITDAEIVLSKLGLNIFCSTRDAGWGEFAITRAAKNLKIPTLMIQEGVFCRDLDRTLATKLRGLATKVLLGEYIDHTYGQSKVDKLCVASEHYKNRFVQTGFPAERIITTGQPRYDELFQLERPPQLNSNPKIYIFTQPSIERGEMSKYEYRRLLRIINEGVCRYLSLREAEIIVRHHPNKGTAESKLIQENLSFPYTQEQAQKDFFDSLSEADLGIGFYSSALLEGLAAGVPCVFLRTKARKDIVKMCQRINIPIAISAEDLVRRMVEGLSQGFKLNQETLTDELGLLDGKAATRVAQEIAKLARLQE